MDRTEKYNLSQKEQLALIGKALSSELRLRILSELEERAYNVNEIAECLQIPASSAALHVRVLEEAGLIETELRAAVRGSMKICRKKVDGIFIDLQQETEGEIDEIHMRSEIMWITMWSRLAEWCLRTGILMWKMRLRYFIIRQG